MRAYRAETPWCSDGRCRMAETGASFGENRPRATPTTARSSSGNGGRQRASGHSAGDHGSGSPGRETAPFLSLKRGLCGILDYRRSRQYQCHCRAAPDRAVDMDISTIGAREPEDLTKSEPGAGSVRLCRKERLENATKHVRRDALLPHPARRRRRNRPCQNRPFVPVHPVE